MSSRVRFACSVWPSVCGWNVVDIASLVPIVWNSIFQNLLVNLASRSEMMDLGRLWSLKTLLKNNRVVSGAVAVVMVGVKWVILENVSKNTTMASNPVLVLGS